MGFIENWGRGYEKIRHDFAQEKLQIPVFEEVRGGFMATIQREVFVGVHNAKSDVTDYQTGTQTGTETDRLNPEIVKLVKTVRDRTMSVHDMMANLGLRGEDNFRKRLTMDIYCLCIRI